MDDLTNTSIANTDQPNRAIQDRAVVALFARQDDARNAQTSLTEAGFDQVEVTWNGEAATDQPKPVHEHGFWASIKAFLGDHEDTGVYGEGLRRGQTMVTVHVEQGRAADAVDILDRFDPTDIEGAQHEWRNDGWQPQDNSSIADADELDAPAAASDRDELQSFDTIVAVVEQPQSSGTRDHNIGNARVRSYFRDDAAGSNNTSPVQAQNQAWSDRSNGVDDKSHVTDSDAAKPADPNTSTEI